MKSTILLFLFCPLILCAQKGINFEHNLSWKEVQEKAVSENKYIFVDAFATWCGPCNYMSKNIYPLEDVGNYFNKYFINVKLQCDITTNDSREVRKWYKDADYLKATYEINAYPTYLIFDPAGKIVHKFMGSSEAKQFIAGAMNGLDPDKQYYSLLVRYLNGNKEPAFLKQLTFASRSAGQIEMVQKISTEYIALQNDMFTRENISFLLDVTQSSVDTGFYIIQNNIENYDRLYGTGAARNKMISILSREVLTPIMMRRLDPDWKTIGKFLDLRYPEYSAEIVSICKIQYNISKQEWRLFKQSVTSYLENFGSTVSKPNLNNWAWVIFVNCKDKDYLKAALQWSERSLNDAQNPVFMDTYANIKYKLGQTDEAIEWEQKALALSNNGDVFKATLEKMNKGQKTWPE